MGGKAAEELIFGIDKVRLQEAGSGTRKPVQRRSCTWMLQMDAATHPYTPGSLAAAAPAMALPAVACCRS